MAAATSSGSAHRPCGASFAIARNAASSPPSFTIRSWKNGIVFHIGVFTPVANMSIEQWHDVIDTNLTGVFYCCRAALPHLKKRGGGWIINISSLAGKNAFPEAAAYCASKSGLNAFSEALMQEVRHDGIRVAYVMPGSVNTNFGGHQTAGADWKLSAEDVAEVVVDLLAHPARSLPSRVEIRPAKPPKKG